MREHPDIELRSKNIRNIIGNVPPTLIRSGISIIAVVLILLFACVCYLPYPHKIQAQAVITEGERYAEAIIPYTHFSQIEIGVPVTMNVEGYNTNTYGYVKGKILKKENKVILYDDERYFKALISFDHQANIPLLENMSVTASILINEKSIIQYFIN